MLGYFSLLDELQETLSNIKLSIMCTIIFKQNAEIADINNAASDFLKRHKIEYSIGEKFHNHNEKQFLDIIVRLQNGQKIRDIQFEFTRLNNNSVFVVLQPALLLGLKDLFIFQFAEIKTTPTKETIPQIRNLCASCCPTFNI